MTYFDHNQLDTTDGGECVITLGRVPERLTVHLTPGDPFTVVLRRKTPAGDLEDWTAPPTLEFDGGPNWVSTITGADASWAVPEAQVDATILACTSRVVRLTLAGVVWAKGLLAVTE